MAGTKPSKAALRARAQLNRRLKRAKSAVNKAARSLDKVIDIYSKKHQEASKLHRLVASKTHDRLVQAIARARTSLAGKLDELLAIENEWKQYFRRL